MAILEEGVQREILKGKVVGYSGICNTCYNRYGQFIIKEVGRHLGEHEEGISLVLVSDIEVYCPNCGAFQKRDCIRAD